MKPKLMTQNEITEASKTHIGAIEGAYKHWCQLTRLSAAELKKRCLKDLYPLSRNECALCHRYHRYHRYYGGSCSFSCVLYSDDVWTACCDEFTVASKGLKEWLRGETSHKAVRAAFRVMRDRLKMELDKERKRNDH